MLEGFDVSQIQDERAKELIIRRLNLVESLSADRREAQPETQRRRDEIARLTGEQGQPDISPNASSGNRNYSSDKDRKGGQGEKEAKASGAQPQESQQQRVRIDRQETLRVNPARLPADAPLLSAAVLDEAGLEQALSEPLGAVSEPQQKLKKGRASPPTRHRRRKFDLHPQPTHQPL